MAGERRRQLLEAAVDYVLRHGVDSLTLRPLAAALETSDRMLVYHFGDKEQLVDEVVRRGYERCFEELARHRRPARTPASGVRRLWEALNAPEMVPYLRLYLDLATSSLYFSERHREANRAMTERWLGVITEWLADAGAPAGGARAVATVVAATLAGLQLDLLTTGDERRVQRALDQLATWVDNAVTTERGG